MRLVRLPCILSLALCGTGFSSPLAAELPQWPLQQQPGPDGDPRQDPATFPRSACPPRSRRSGRPRRPSLTDAGNGDLVLSGGWKLQEARKVAGTARELSVPGFDASSWFDATVPGTVLTTLVDQGVYPEPTYGLDNLAIPESLNREDYWYRNEFTPPADAAGRTLTPHLQRRSTTPPTSGSTARGSARSAAPSGAASSTSRRWSEPGSPTPSWCASRRCRTRASRTRSRSRPAPAPTAARCSSTARPSSAPRAGTGSPASATARPASGRTSCCTSAAR